MRRMLALMAMMLFLTGSIAVPAAPATGDGTAAPAAAGIWLAARYRRKR